MTRLVVVAGAVATALTAAVFAWTFSEEPSGFLWMAPYVGGYLAGVVAFRARPDLVAAGTSARATSSSRDAGSVSAVIDDLHAGMFAPYEGSTFTATRDGVSVPVVLAKVEEVPPTTGAPRTDPFLLTFTGPPGTTFEHGTYTLSHEAMGTYDVYLIPRLPGPDRLPRVEALFN